MSNATCGHLLALAAALCVWPPTLGTERFVASATCPSIGSGTRDDPFCSVQRALDLSAAGDLVTVAAGVYEATSRRAIDLDGFQDEIDSVLFMKSGVTVRGAGPGASILDALTRATVVVADRCDAQSSLAGFTLRGGGLGSGAGFDFGDGLLVNGGSPRFADLEIETTEGGFAAADVLGAAAPRLERLHVHHNGQNAPLTAAVLIAEGSSVSLDSCVITENRGADAGGILADGSGLSLLNCVVAGNQGTAGGGIRLRGGSSGSLVSSTVAANTSGVAGAGVRLEDSTATITSCILGSNRSLSGQVGGLFADGSSQVAVAHTDAHGNLDTDYQSRLDPTGTNGNISTDPRFRDLQTFDLRLLEGSPAIDAGAPPIGPFDLSGAPRSLDGDLDGLAAPDMGALEFDRSDVRGLTVVTPPFQIAWDALPEATGYLVYRGSPEGLAGGDYGECLTAGGDLPDTRFDDAASPASGKAWFYLAVARVIGGTGTLGFDSRGLERIRRAGAPCP